jgi:hypothetical protein
MVDNKQRSKEELDYILSLPEYARATFLRSGLSIDEFEKKIADMLNEAFKHEQ